VPESAETDPALTGLSDQVSYKDVFWQLEQGLIIEGDFMMGFRIGIGN
jgi:hypothetical protein